MFRTFFFPLPTQVIIEEQNITSLEGSFFEKVERRGGYKRPFTIAVNGSKNTGSNTWTGKHKDPSCDQNERLIDL